MKNISFLTNKLKELGCKFNELGFPIINENQFSCDIPEYIAPYNHKNSYKYKEKTSICFYIDDKSLYPRIENIDLDINEYKNYSSILSLDISVSKNMPYNVQEYNMYQNSLYTAYLAYSGVKVIPSIRCGDENTIQFLSIYKNAPIIAFGIHGCKYTKLESYDELMFLNTINYLNPEKILFYGRLSKKEKEIVDDLNILYEEYDDFVKLYKGGKLC